MGPTSSFPERLGSKVSAQEKKKNGKKKKKNVFADKLPISQSVLTVSTYNTFENLSVQHESGWIKVGQRTKG